MKHPIINGVLNSIDEVYKIIKPFSFIKKGTNIIEKVKYIKSYELLYPSINRFKINLSKRNRLNSILSYILFDVMSTDTEVKLSEVWNQDRSLMKSLELYQYVLECVYFRLDKTQKHLLMHYSPIATYGREWNEFTRKTRGIIINAHTREIVAYPHDKFYNLNEMEETKVENLPDLLYEDAHKLDGSMGILYKNAYGKIIITTKGSFESEQGQFATELLYNKYSDTLHHIEKNKLTKMFTFIFEIIYANTDKNRIVVDYGSEPDIKLIGVRDLSTFEMLPYEKVVSWANTLGVPHTTIETMDLNKMLELKVQRKNFEGWVRRYSNGLFLKVKCDEYLEHHGAKYGSSEKAVWHLLRNDTWDDFIANVPLEFSPRSVQIHDKLITFIQGKLREMHKIYDSLPEIEDQKEFALYVNKNVQSEYKDFMFQIRNGKEIDYIQSLLSWQKFRDRMNKYYEDKDESF